jgi:hypothetical protein
MAMSERPLTFDQIRTMRTAIDMVQSSLGPYVSRRAKIVSVIVPHAGLDGYSAARLANLALEKMGLAIRVCDDEDDKAREGGAVTFAGARTARSGNSIGFTHIWWVQRDSILRRPLALRSSTWTSQAS